MTNDKCLPKVSVVVPIYNGEADLPDLVRCLQAQTYPTDQVEYLLVDNNSRDRTASLIETAVTEGASEGITFHYILEDQIQSSYAARNKGIRAAKGEIIAFTDADCRPQPHWLADLVSPFAKVSIGIVAGQIIGLPGKTWLEKHAEYHNVLSQEHTLNHSYCPYGQTANLAIRRQALEEVGLFRPYLTTGGDADICWRIQKQSKWQLHLAPTAIVEHRHRSTFREYHSQWHRYGRSNRYLHQLHGVPLMRDIPPREYLYRISRWLLKELPRNSINAIAGKTDPIELISTPIGLFGTWARAKGQQEARLPDKADQIEWFSHGS
ncbi:MAG: glycosyltransferase [Moorea sp. SIO3I7]|nr:glycosyltransferase [Moorena sp. SIO3I7]